MFCAQFFYEILHVPGFVSSTLAYACSYNVGIKKASLWIDPYLTQTGFHDPDDPFCILERNLSVEPQPRAGLAQPEEGLKLSCCDRDWFVGVLSLSSQVHIIVLQPFSGFRRQHRKDVLSRVGDVLSENFRLDDRPDNVHCSFHFLA